MLRKAKTIKKRVEFEGLGVRTGKISRFSLEPVEEPVGYLFVLSNGKEVKASFENVKSYDRQTMLEKDGSRVLLVEHLLSALYGMGIDHVVIRFEENNEVPIFDGSAKVFVEKIKEAGIKELDFEVKVLELDRPIRIKDGNAYLLAVPDEDFTVSYGIRYPEGVNQFMKIEMNEENYFKEIAPARTYIFEHDLKRLFEEGEIKAGDLNNAIVIGEDGKILNESGLRFNDEFVRHKILDLIGDLALSGLRLKGHIIAGLTGHKHHLELVRRLKARVGFMDIAEILKYMPHRYPFLLIDRIVELEDNRVVAIKNVTINEPFFEGHFPGYPIMPGVLILEAMAQAGGFLLLNRIEDREKKLLFFAGIDEVKFKRPVLPGDTLYLEGELLRFGGRTAKFKGVAKVGDRVVAEAILKAVIVER